MRPFAVNEITEMVTGLHQLARNLWWTWDQDAQDLFSQLSPRSWRNLYHNPVAVLHEVSEYELRVRLHNRLLADQVRRVLRKWRAYMNDRDTWGAKHAPELLDRPVAYFSAEFGFHETLPISAGGLGVLAGDHMKSASDLGLGMVGLSLFYREGYFIQTVNEENWQVEHYAHLNPRNLPLEPVLDGNGEPVVCSLDIGMTEVFFRAWRINVGRVPVYLLDTDIEPNEQRMRDLTLRVYGGDSTTRIMQEMLLGIGGVRLLRALGVQPSVFHMNEGHSAFLTLELAREKFAAGMPWEQALEEGRKECVFTTHTPVPAGHDRFNKDLVGYAFSQYVRQLGTDVEGLMRLGRVKPEDHNETFCMTVLALRQSRAANAVSELHGRVSREMWHCLYPDRPVEEVPIGHITNGVHLLGWMKGTVRRFWRRELCGPLNHNGSANGGEADATNGPLLADANEILPSGLARWEAELVKPEFWQRIEDPEFVKDEELWALRYRLRRELIEFTRRRLLIQGERISRKAFIEYDHLLNVDALTIGFARRFATYKRAALIFDQFDNIVRLVKDRNQPVQFIFAGKAHPRDDEGKRLIQKIIHLSKYSDLRGHLVFIEDYDIHVARMMVSGCDVWLNNPRRPLEASGTSGMKCGPHGCLNLSILDGWWREGYDGTNGFAIGEDSHPDNIQEQDRIDSANLYRVLSEQVIPLFYNRDEAGIPRQWIRMMRRAMATLVPRFTTDRMVREYVERYYLPRS
ncbi:MAG: alpha-glucan family phosphorylase [Verrucomicrobia bacterium]|nr:MAG: alpha-glucan family phosphorylase [Verrucomicrobiota bacterium]